MWLCRHCHAGTSIPAVWTGRHVWQHVPVSSVLCWHTCELSVYIVTFRDAPIIGIGRFADNQYRPIITLVSADYRLHTCCIWWCENDSDAVVSSGDHRSRRERGGVTGVGRGARHGWWLVSDRPRRATPPHATPLANPHVSIVNVELYSVNCGLLSCFWNFLY